MNGLDDENKELTEGLTALEAAENDDPAVPVDEGAEKQKSPPFSDALDWVGSIAYAIVAMLILNLFFFRSISVSGDSMNDTLIHGDKVLLTNFFYSPSRGDIVVVQADRLKNKETGMFGEPIIKRVIAVEGDTIRFDFAKGEVYLNDELLEEDYIRELTHLRTNGWVVSGETYTVPENCVFVMGDNRNVSNDSRNLKDVGYIDVSMIMGKAIVRYAPVKDFKWL